MSATIKGTKTKATPRQETTGSPFVLFVFVLFVFFVPCTRAAQGQERFALVVSGATGGQEYATQYQAWSDSLKRIFTQRFRIDPDNVVVLAEGDDPARASTADNVRKTVAQVQQQMKRDDLLVIVLIGHGTFDGVDAKFNLVGRDMESAEWGTLLRPVPGTVVVVNTTAGSFPFIERLAGPRRIVITATDSVAQRFDTVFPEYFVKAFEDDGADLDKNQRISIWEAFAFASGAVRRHYQQRGQLSTERPLIDDNGDGVGRAVAEDGQDGTASSRTYLENAKPGAPETDEELLKLLQRKSLLEAELEELRIRKTFLPSAEYAKEFERLITDYARVSSSIRERKKT